MKLTTLTGTLMLAFVPGAVLADMNYTNFEIGYVDADLDSSFANIDGDGFGLSGSYEIQDNLFVFGQLDELSYDADIDATTYEIGLGLAHAFNEDLDFVGSISYVDAEFDVGPVKVGDDGFALGAGIRSRVAASVEVDAGLRFVDLDQSGSDTGLRLSGRYYFTPSMAASLGADLNDGADTMRLGFRAEF